MDIFKNIPKTYEGEEVQYIDINEIIPSIIRLINQELKQDIINYGMSDPLIIRSRDKVCIRGNQRLAILKELEIKEVPVIIIKPVIKEIELLNQEEIGIKIAGYDHEIELCFEIAEIENIEDLKNKIRSKIEEIENLQPPQETKPPNISEFKVLEGQII